MSAPHMFVNANTFQNNLLSAQKEEQGHKVRLLLENHLKEMYVCLTFVEDFFLLKSLRRISEETSKVEP